VAIFIDFAAASDVGVMSGPTLALKGLI